MRKKLAVLGLMAVLAIPAAAFGNAALNPGNVGEGCDGDGLYHFVARKGSWTDKLDVNFSGGAMNGQSPTAVNNGVAHFWVEGSGTVNGAYVTGTADKLVLSQVICDSKKGGDDGEKK
jgi:hypothetical protein